MKAIKFLTQKGLLRRGNTQFFVKFEDGTKLEFVELLEEYHRQKNQSKNTERKLKERIEHSINNKDCLKCKHEELDYAGESFESFGWCQHYICSNCNSLHEYSPNDMGQSSAHLSLVKYWGGHVPYKKK